MSLEPRVFLVTGAAGGIGRRLVERAVEAGHRVLATDLRAPTDLPAGVQAVALDVRDPAAWTAALDAAEAAFGPVDVLCNVAGYLKPGWVAELEAIEVARHVDVNTKGVMYGTIEAARRMKARGQGHIINIASLAALAPIPGLALYSASKYAVRAFSLAAAHELAPAGVAVTVICPDAVQTPMLDLQVHHEEAALTFSGGRVLTPDDVCDAVFAAVKKRPREIHLPRSRAWMARTADLFPGLTGRLDPLLRRAGQRKQAKRKEK